MIKQNPFHLRRYVILGFISLCVALFPGCLGGLGEPSKPLHFYTIDPLSQETSTNKVVETSAKNGVTISVKAFQGSGIYQEKPILWRDNQHLQRFQFNRWANPPARMLQDAVVEFLRQESGEQVAWVYNAGVAETNSPYVVRGNLRHLFLTRQGNNWEINLKLDLHLVKQNPNEVAPISTSENHQLGRWSLIAQGRATAPSGEPQTPSAMNNLIDALNKNLSSTGKRISKDIIERVAEDASSADENSSDENEQK